MASNKQTARIAEPKQTTLVCHECGAEIIEEVCQCTDAEDREAAQEELRDKAERQSDSKSGYPTCHCGQLLCEYEITTNYGDCFGCRVWNRQENIIGMCKASGTVVHRTRRQVWYVVDGIVWRVKGDRAIWMGHFCDWCDTMRACGRNVAI